MTVAITMTSMRGSLTKSADGRVATVATRHGESRVQRKGQKGPLDSDQPPHGRRLDPLTPTSMRVGNVANENARTHSRESGARLQLQLIRQAAFFAALAFARRARCAAAILRALAVRTHYCQLPRVDQISPQCTPGSSPMFRHHYRDETLRTSVAGVSVSAAETRYTEALAVPYIFLPGPI